MTTLAFKATYSDWKLIKTRGVVQVVMEVPLADADAAYNVLGGMPDFSRETWFAIAPLKQEREVMPNPLVTTGLHNAQPLPAPKSAGAKREGFEWRDMQPSAQAGIRCNDPVFWKFLEEEYGRQSVSADNCAEHVRSICCVSSRSELVTNHKARVLWHQLDIEFLAWKLVTA